MRASMHHLELCTSPLVNPSKRVVNDQAISLPFFSPLPPSPFPPVTHPIPERTPIRLCYHQEHWLIKVRNLCMQAIRKITTKIVCTCKIHAKFLHAMWLRNRKIQTSWYVSAYKTTKCKSSDASGKAFKYLHKIPIVRSWTCSCTNLVSYLRWNHCRVTCLAFIRITSSCLQLIQRCLICLKQLNRQRLLPV